jgi:hypothetical protein
LISVFSEAMERQLATKADVVRLEAKFDYELRLLKWMMGLSLAASAGILSLLARVFFALPH